MSNTTVKIQRPKHNRRVRLSDRRPDKILGARKLNKTRRVKVQAGQ